MLFWRTAQTRKKSRSDNTPVAGGFNPEAYTQLGRVCRVVRWQVEDWRWCGDEKRTLWGRANVPVVSVHAGGELSWVDGLPGAGEVADPRQPLPDGLRAGRLVATAPEMASELGHQGDELTE